MLKKIQYLTLFSFMLLSVNSFGQDTTKIDYIGSTSKGDNPPLHYLSNPVDTFYKSSLPVYRDMLGDTSVITNNGQKQYTKFEEGNYPFPPKPKSLWELGIGAGTFFISGDVKAQLGYGFSAHIRKSLGYTVSLEGLFLHGTAYGLNWEASAGLANNPVYSNTTDINGVPNPTDYYHDGGIVFHNFKMINNEASLNMVVTLNNIGFHRKSADRKINLYGMGGIGIQNYTVMYNALDPDGNRYDYLSIYQNETADGVVTKDDRKPTLTDLKNMMDNTYETAAEGHKDEEGLFDRTMNPIANGGVSIAFRLSRRVNLELNHKVSFTNDDLEDGQRWQEFPPTSPVLTRDFDTYHYTSLNINMNIGKSVEPLYWQNPLDYAYQTLSTLQQKNVDELVDTDGDGVLDKLDNEPNTPLGNTVDTHGVTMDSDKDGIPDAKDPYPFGGPYNTQVNNTTTNSSNICVMTKFPSVHFDLDKYYIKPEFYSSLYEVAFAMISCPDRKMVCTGHTDVREGNDYNMVLSWERVTKVVDYLVTTYGIDRSRFIVKFEGEAKPRIPGLPDNSWAPIYEPRQYQNRRVEFRWADTGETGNSNPPKPNGPKKAGEDY